MLFRRSVSRSGVRCQNDSNNTNKWKQKSQRHYQHKGMRQSDGQKWIYMCRYFFQHFWFQGGFLPKGLFLLSEQPIPNDQLNVTVSLHRGSPEDQETNSRPCHSLVWSLGLGRFTEIQSFQMLAVNTQGKCCTVPRVQNRSKQRRWG